VLAVRRHGRAAHISTLLLVLAGWLGLSLVAYLLVLPLVTVARRRDRPLHARRGLAPPATVPSPQRLGYAGTVLQRLVEHGRTVLGVHQAWIAVDPRGDGPGFTAAAAGTDPDLIGARLSADNSTPDLAASVPVIVGGRSHGRLCVASPVHAGELQPQDFDLLGELASLTGEALNHHQRRDPTAGDSQAEINALVRAMAAVDGDTYRHSLEVAATALAVAERLGLEGVDLVEVELGALLHDVGKLHLPPRILKKAGPLDPEELRLVRMHPEWGANMVARIPGLEAVALVVRLHHERPDGRGYPHGLPHDRIPMAARIVSVCDAYGAMTRRRDYSEPLDVDAALAELEMNTGTQFDELAVEVLGSYVREPVLVAA
jgi:putative nucleotidyltransferase with HDIG domain